VQWWTSLLISLAVVLVIYAAVILWLVVRGRREDARAFATFIPDCIVLVTRLARDPRVPRRRKLLLVALVAYLGLPFDLVPDFIPVAGQLDDAIIVALVLRYFVRAGGEPMLQELWPGPEQSLRLILRLARPRRARPLVAPISDAPHRGRNERREADDEQPDADQVPEQRQDAAYERGAQCESHQRL
jgi:uncharacterized membrane protein YkvA (DUF1232 family)